MSEEKIVPVELMGVEEQLQEHAGFWRSCSGCLETEDGHPVGEYPYSEVLKCTLGGGCRECGGIGAIWDDTDYSDLGVSVDDEPTSPQQQESEAGAFGTVVTFDDGSNVFRNKGEPFPPTAKGYIATEVYTAPPSVQAIETAAIMKCAELVKKRHGPYYEILTLTPQDGRTALEEFGMKVAEAIEEAVSKAQIHDLDVNLEAIVANLIGAAK